MTKKFLIIIFYFLSACSGYQPIYKAQNTNDYLFKSIEVAGDQKINKRIVSALNLKKDDTDESLNEIKITSKKNIENTSKDSLGQVSSYRTTVQLYVTIKNSNNIIKEKQFIKDFSYNKKENKFDLIEYQKEIEKSLVNKIIEELILYLNLK